RGLLLMPLLFMMMLPQIDLLDTVVSQLTNRFQSFRAVREQEAAGVFTRGHNTSRAKLDVDPLGSNMHAICQFSNGETTRDRRPTCLATLDLYTVLEANALHRGRDNFVRFPR
ncbi:hypothetical protein, partial [Bradyrhizobium sp. ORS 285]